MLIELDVKLIKCVENFPFLYYKGALNYNNELLLANTWRKIGKDLKVTPEYCMNRWKYLRRRYTKELKFALPEKEWILIKYLRFLEPFIHRRKHSETRPEFESSEREYQNSICSRDEWEKESPSAASESTTLLSWKSSNDSFCQSLSNTLQTLTTDQQVSCRIDILVVIEKYLSSNNVVDGPKSTNSTPSNFHSRLDTLASDLSKRFEEISIKMNCGSISLFDEDWLIIFATKNFFCKLLEMRKVNTELDKMLPALVTVNPSSQILEEHGSQVISVPQTTAEPEKPFSMNRRSEVSTMGGSNEPQLSPIFNPLVSNSAEYETVEIKTESADFSQLYSSERVSQNTQHVPQLNQNLVDPSPPGKPIHQMGVHHYPAENLCTSNLTPASSKQVKASPIKTQNSGIQFGSAGPVSQNLQSMSSSKNSNYVSLKPSLAKPTPKSAPPVTSNNVIHIRPPANVKNASNSTVNLRTSTSTVNLGLSNSTNPRFPNISASGYIPGRSTEFENAVHETLKNINSVDANHGFMPDGNRFLCVLCDVWLPSELYKKAHTRASAHMNYTRDYFLHCNRVKKTALPKLDKSVYVAHIGGLQCNKCQILMQNRCSFLSHMKCERHRTKVENLPRYVDIEVTMIGSIDQVIVSIGSSKYCVLCNLKLFDTPPAEHFSSARHQSEIALLKGIFKIDRHAYCSHCTEKFPLAALTLHVNNEKHSSKISFYNSR